MRVSRRDVFKTGGMAGLALGAGALGSWVPRLRAAAPKVKIGVTDWNLRKTMDIAAVELARTLGFDGVEVSLGRNAGEQLPAADPALQQKYLEESRKHSLPLPSTCLDVLHRNYLKNDPLGRRWVADSIGVTKALGARVILLPFFGKGALQTQQEKDYVGDVLREVAPEAEKAGVVFGLEDTISAEDNVRIMDRAKSPAVLTYYDVGNSTNNGFDILKEIRWLGKDRICEFHLKDNPNLLGHGKIDMPRVIDAIAEIGFEGWAHLETSSPRKNLEMDMSYNLGYVRALVQRQV